MESFLSTFQNNFINFFSTLTGSITWTDKSFAYIAAAVALFSGIGVAIGQGYIGGKAVEAVSRNPEVEASIFKQFIVAVSICESVAIYSLIVALILIFKAG